ncbi:hypothetical protein JNJ66_03960 [Candidatus Saccharibacteria bacterium]|nr:hypothetical protein [Candidatus Saccharibacteria bacterium]
MKKTTAPESLWPYTERNGDYARSHVETLLREPEVVLDGEERAEAVAFAHGLVKGEADDVTCESSRSLEAVYKASVLAGEQAFYLPYFRTPEGQNDLVRLGLGPDADDEQIIAAVSDLDAVKAAMKPTERKQIANRSVRWRRAELADRLLDDPEADLEKTDGRIVNVNYDPDKILAKLGDLQSFRSYYRTLYRQTKELPESGLKEAKLTLINVHMGRINAMLADLYPSAYNLARQLDRSETTEQTETWSDRLAEVAQTVVIVHKAVKEERLEKATYMRRLDYIRNGASVSENGPTPISQVLLEHVENLDTGSQELPEPVIDARTLEQLDTTEWTADQVAELSTAVLEEWGLLSEHTASWDEVDERDGPAEDGKWQVVVHPKKDNLSVNGAKKVVMVPDSFKRTLSQVAPAGALVVAAHELTHVLQNEYDDALAKELPLARIKGRRYVTMREAGGIYQEKTFQAMLGRDRPANPHYLRALQVKEAGGTIHQQVRAFFNSAVEAAGVNPDEAFDGVSLKPEKVYSLMDQAADRVLRLHRGSGHESQPLDYIEQDLIMQALEDLGEDQRAAVIIAGGSFALQDAAALHRVGLFDIPQGVDIEPAADVMRIYQERFAGSRAA